MCRPVRRRLTGLDVLGNHRQAVEIELQRRAAGKQQFDPLAICGAGIIRPIDRCARLDQAANNSATPLMIACQYAHLPVVSRLIEAGASVDRADDAGTTPLFIACLNGHLPVVSRLIEAGASVDQAEDDGATPLFIACEHASEALGSAARIPKGS